MRKLAAAVALVAAAPFVSLAAEPQPPPQGAPTSPQTAPAAPAPAPAAAPAQAQPPAPQAQQPQQQPQGQYAPPPQYAQPPQGQYAPPPQYAQPPQGQYAPPPQYAQPPQGQYAPPAQYPPPPQGQYAPPPQYAQPPQGQYAPPAQYPPPPQGQYAPPAQYPPPQGQYAPPPQYPPYGYAPPPGGYPQPGAYAPPYGAPPAPPVARRYQRDGWYIGFGLGGGDGNVQDTSGTYSFSRYIGGGPTTASFNFKVGVTLSPRALLGLDLSVVDSSTSDNSVTVNIANYDAMVTVFPWERGFFVRAGGGLSRFTLDLQNARSPIGPVTGTATVSGTNVAAGIGYAWWLGQQFNLTANLDFSNQWWSGHEAGAPTRSDFWSLGLGFDWY